MSAEGAAVARPLVSMRLFLSVIAAAAFLAVMTASMVNVVMPVMRAEFGVTEAQIGWVVTGFMLVMAIGVPMYGRISDFYSLRWVFCFGLLVFALGSLICALAPNLPVLVFGRMVQAAGDAAIPALAFVAVAKLLPPGRRGGALGLLASAVGLGAATGPILGGVVAQFAGWRFLFVGAGVAILLLIPAAARVLPNGASGGPRRFDLAGGVLLGLAAGSFLFGVTQGQVLGFAAASSWGSFVMSALAAASFTRRITTTPQPFVSPALFKNRAYVAAVGVGFFMMFANVSMFVFVSLLVVEVNGLSPGAAGLVLTPAAIAMAVLSPWAGRLSDRVGVRTPIVFGLSTMALSMVFVSTFAAGNSPVWVSAGMLGSGIGFAFANSPTTNAAAGALPVRDVGAGLGIFQGAFFLGGGTGPALVGAFLAARREAAVDAINPLYALHAAPYSDAFLLISVAPLCGLLALVALRGGRRERTPYER